MNKLKKYQFFILLFIVSMVHAQRRVIYLPDTIIDIPERIVQRWIFYLEPIVESTFDENGEEHVGLVYFYKTNFNLLLNTQIVKDIIPKYIKDSTSIQYKEIQDKDTSVYYLNNVYFNCYSKYFLEGTKYPCNELEINNINDFNKNFRTVNEYLIKYGGVIFFTFRNQTNEKEVNILIKPDSLTLKNIVEQFCSHISCKKIRRKVRKSMKDYKTEFYFYLPKENELYEEYEREVLNKVKNCIENFKIKIVSSTDEL